MSTPGEGIGGGDALRGVYSLVSRFAYRRSSGSRCGPWSLMGAPLSPKPGWLQVAFGLLGTFKAAVLMSLISRASPGCPILAVIASESTDLRTPEFLDFVIPGVPDYLPDMGPVRVEVPPVFRRSRHDESRTVLARLYRGYGRRKRCVTPWDPICTRPQFGSSCATVESCAL
jgi:hypothetical protein